MKNRLIIVVSLLAVLLSSCAVTDIDRSADFGRLKKFAWGTSEVTVSNPVHKSDLIDKRIKSVMADEFQKKGIMLVDQNPDFYVNYKTHTEKKTETRRTMPGHYGMYGFFPYAYFPYWGGFYGYPWSMMPSYEHRDYTQGTLVIDIVDAHTRETVWRGSVSGKVDDPKALQKQIDKGVKAILKKYPKAFPEEERNVLPERDAIG